MLTLTDTHCHLDFDRFDADRARVIERAAQKGVSRILVPGIDLSSSRAAVALAEKFEMVYAAVGVHPNSGTTWQTNTKKNLVELADHPKVVAIGEIGLDYYRDWTPQPMQRKIFREQLDMAAEVGLPVVIHDREAHEAVIPALLEWQESLDKEGLALAKKPGVLHSYSGNIKQADLILIAGYYLGITGPVTFKNAVEVQEVARKAPEDRLLIETDGPFLTPHPHRGKRNEPSYVYYVAEKIAELRGVSPQKVGEFTSNNAKNLFSW
ncbi:MAG: YchF/TatD family DNA exonuclease [candidate division Zixibacteria bacterium]|nr:YchF/TatD family DNA exonuclease [Gammaproteobacteria bacterium]NIX56124.1 YchF/TatD family DNA exonuclease [candidate division Zixibacteria bacterium]